MTSKPSKKAPAKKAPAKKAPAKKVAWPCPPPEPATQPAPQPAPQPYTDVTRVLFENQTAMRNKTREGWQPFAVDGGWVYLMRKETK
jgi:hypothetical protein